MLIKRIPSQDPIITSAGVSFLSKKKKKQNKTKQKNKQKYQKKPKQNPINKQVYT